MIIAFRIFSILTRIFHLEECQLTFLIICDRIFGLLIAWPHHNYFDIRVTFVATVLIRIIWMSLDQFLLRFAATLLACCHITIQNKCFPAKTGNKSNYSLEHNPSLSTGIYKCLGFTLYSKLFFTWRESDALVVKRESGWAAGLMTQCAAQHAILFDHLTLTLLTLPSPYSTTLLSSTLSSF